MNETSPLQKQDITPIYDKLNDVIKLLREISKLLNDMAKKE